MPATFRNNRPAALPGQTLQLDTPCGRLYVTVNRDLKSGEPVELLCRFGKAGTCGSAVMDGLTRMISFGLRAGVPPATVVQELGGIACHRGIRSCMDSLAQAIRETEREFSERVNA
ncbi:ribonucleotide-diphosphate reductase subunit alpha [Geobacter sp. OR-1]|uniref:TSCPD domain-containing protein n=1 Tax=Geobacter sp. OR-1 TaxID=1266765 RepID=UPI000541A44E|nr:TSCPD domain-containing protein [Geobacter sp. OR-1]GAM10332.1 ribonucleotide-diphosphate reductase subunit alpha [Geobacter sp. OR-1]